MTDTPTPIDVRAEIRARVDEAAKLHQPDGYGYCQVCDPMVAYPCGPRWQADQALDSFDRRGG